MMKYIRVASVVFALLLVVSLAGCKSSEILYGSLSEDGTSSEQTPTTNVPIVVIEDDKDDTSSSLADTDDIINKWENESPELEIETDDNVSSDSSKTDSSENDSSDEESSSSQNSSSDNSSESDDNSDSDKEDDGYFDVAV